MTTTTRSTESSAVGATLYVALELGSTKWTVGFTTELGQRARVRSLAAGDRDTLSKEILLAKARFGLALDTPVRSCYEAGRDGFWLHRWLTTEGIHNLVVDSSSIEVNRRARRAKTDRLDVGKLLVLLCRWHRGERVWSVVQVPSFEVEAQRQLTREIATVREDRKRVHHRIQSLLATQGIRLALGRRFLAHLATAVTGDGQPLLPAFRARLEREWQSWMTIDARLQELSHLRDAQIADGTDAVAVTARRLCALRGLGETSAAVLSAELYGTRRFTNGRQLGALVGLVPVPYRSDQRVSDQGISKAGRTELRRTAVQLAWLWVRWQPGSTLAQWFHRRFVVAGKRSKRVGIVAVARKLIIALWRFVEHGVVPEGAALKA